MSEPRPDEPLRVALLGCGVVGSAVARLLTQHRDDLAARVGRPARHRRHRRAPPRPRPQRPRPSTRRCSPTDAEDLVTRADVVVEVIGGIEPARALILRAMKHGASVVTANKALLAQDGPTLYAAAQDAGVDLYYEAAVAGAIPLLRPAARVARRRRRPPRARHRQRHDQLRPRQDGHDRRQLRTTPSSRPRRWATPRPTPPPTSRASTPPPRPRSSRRLAFHTRVSGADVHREGITEVTAADVRPRPRRWTRVVKLLAICERTARRRVSRPRPPGDDPEVAPAGRRPRGVQRGLRRGRRRRPADVLRPRRGRRPDRLRGPRRRRRRRPAPGRRRPRTGGVRLRRPADPADGPGPDAVPHQPRRGRPPGCPRRRSRRPSPSTASPSRRSASRSSRPPATRGPTGAPAWSSSRIRRPTPRSSATVEALAAMPDRPRRRLGHARRRVLTWLTSGAA